MTIDVFVSNTTSTFTNFKDKVNETITVVNLITANTDIASNTYVNATFATNTYVNAEFANVNATFATNTYVNAEFATIEATKANNTYVNLRDKQVQDSAVAFAIALG